MNFLAHIYLSGNNEDIILGNFIADSIKGKKYLLYPKKVQKGILLHRAIDTYTDSHSIVRASASKLYKNYHHYSGVIVDIYYDHFLASNWKDYSEIPLEVFVSNFYQLLKNNQNTLPPPVKSFLPIMISENWLSSYAHLNGIKKILIQMNRRTKNIIRMDKAIDDLQEHYEELENEFKVFFPQLINFSKKKLKDLNR